MQKTEDSVCLMKMMMMVMMMMMMRIVQNDLNLFSVSAT